MADMAGRWERMVGIKRKEYYSIMFSTFRNENWVCDFNTHPDRASLEGVFIETRPIYDDIKYALTNFSCHIPYAALTVICSDENIDGIKQITGTDTHIRFLKLNLEPPFTLDKFDDLLTTPVFWDQFHGERIMFFMTDTGIRKNDVLRFLKYDWVGAPWHHFPVGDPRVFQGNGALSIRNPKLLKEIAIGFKRGNFGEDVFFSAGLALSISGAVLPSRTEAIKFSMEGTDYPDTLGFHNTQTYKETSIAWSGYEGPSRQLVHVERATADSHDVTDLIRIGIGARCLRIGSGALIRKGAKRLVIDDNEWNLEDGYVKDDIIILPK
jgi:hypothetical protein